MKKFKFILSFTIIFVFIYSCKNPAVEAFKKNSETMQLLFESYANESVDYSKFADDVVFRGTLLGSPDSLNLDQIKGIHKEFFAKYDVKHMAPFNYLQGVNPQTGQADESVRMYYKMQVTNTTNGKSVVIPIYESFDFNEEGKAVFVQWYSDWTASIESIE